MDCAGVDLAISYEAVSQEIKVVMWPFTKKFPLFVGSSKRRTADAFCFRFNRQQVIESRYHMFD